MALTLAETYGKYGLQLQADQFISEPGPCENQRMYYPVIEVPVHLMKPSKAKLASMALERCQQITGQLGQQTSRYDSFEFVRPAAVFLEITGVDPTDIFALAQAKLGIR